VGGDEVELVRRVSPHVTLPLKLHARLAARLITEERVGVLVRRREPRGVGLYTACAVLVVLYALSVQFGIGAEAPPSGPRLSDSVMPALWLSFSVAVALVQLRRQTLLGWFLLLGGFTVVAVGLCYLMVTEQLFDPWPLTLLATAIAICVGLILHRPTR
jgi:peptidoglycan/LPS O-acetylase OafA/YrhL